MENNTNSQNKVRVFSTPSCPYCVTLGAFLDEKGVQYEHINVAEDEKAREEMIEKSGQMGVPVIEINGEMIVGFDRDKIVEKLGL
ncbi:glutathione S-transferase N-terminal domain-containing protein [Patescibacteria group bacterium]|nr:glutathione S-transferase N-terminal domain-containing protein [Patescibacteria group bacterium]MBU2579359.1 glutathione S-transferase N-terminal domain-containing protein [Patescibacteria group bacterium]